YLAQGLVYKAVNGATFAKAHFVFGRMHIDVDHGWVDSQEEHKSGLAVAMQDICISLAHSVCHSAILDVSSVDIQILPVGAAAGVGGSGNYALQGDQALLVLYI